MASNLFNSIIAGLFGTKAQKDQKALLPYVDQINAETETFKAYTNDELRARGAELRQEAREAIRPLQEEIATIKARLDREELSMDEREKQFHRIDQLEKEIGEQVEVVLNRILPPTFALVRETARRFAEHEEIEVTATEFDRKLAGQGMDFLRIDGDKAIYVNHWQAGGSPVTWDMVHYDVQLMGGVVLHQGKIAEMSTGEGKTLVATPVS